MKARAVTTNLHRPRDARGGTSRRCRRSTGAPPRLPPPPCDASPWTPREPANLSGHRSKGSISVFVVIFSVAVFLLAGLLVDGGSMINSRLRAADIAEQAARAGADTIDVDALRATGDVKISDADTACAKASEIASAHEGAGASVTLCEVSGDQITVRVAVLWEVFFLGAVGLNDMEVEAEAVGSPRTSESEP